MEEQTGKIAKFCIYLYNDLKSLHIFEPTLAERWRALPRVIQLSTNFANFPISEHVLTKLCNFSTFKFSDVFSSYGYRLSFLPESKFSL